MTEAGFRSRVAAAFRTGKTMDTFFRIAGQSFRPAPRVNRNAVRMFPAAPALPGPSCLIVVDLQHQFVNDHTRHILPGIQALLPRFDWVFASRLLPLPGGPMHRWKGFLPPSSDDPGSALAIDLDVRNPAHTRVIEKTGFGALNASARDELGRLGIREAHVCGVDTDLCVLRTVGDLMELAIRPVVLTDLVASTAGEPLHRHGLLFLKRLAGKAQLVTGPTLSAPEVLTPR